MGLASAKLFEKSDAQLQKPGRVPPGIFHQSKSCNNTLPNILHTIIESLHSFFDVVQNLQHKALIIENIF